MGNPGDRNGVAHALHFCAGHLRGVNANHLPVHIDQGTAAVSWIDSRVRLDIGGCLFTLGQGIVPAAGNGTVFSAYNACGHRLPVAKGIADGHNLFPYL